MLRNYKRVTKNQNFYGDFMEVECVLIELKDGALEKVSTWARFINANKRKALLTLENERVTLESFFLTRIENKDFLIGYMRSSSIEKAHLSFNKSNSEIDECHLEFKKDTWAKHYSTKLLVDLSRIQNESQYA